MTVLTRPPDHSATAKLSVPSLQELFTSDPDQFVAMNPDSGANNLACARGLPNANEDEYPQHMELLDTIAEAVRRQTEKNWRLFKLKKAQFQDSENVFRVMTMEHVFRVQFRVRYDQTVHEIVESGQVWNSVDSSEVFIHGLLSDKRTGTCSTLPTFAIAVGRRLGYPLYLVLVPHHQLYRWDDGKEVFNYQPTSAGGEIKTDDYYYEWPVKWTPQDYELNAYTKIWLHCLTPRREISKFLCNRALILRDTGRFDEAVESLLVAERFDQMNPAVPSIRHSVWSERDAKMLVPDSGYWCTNTVRGPGGLIEHVAVDHRFPDDGRKPKGYNWS